MNDKSTEVQSNDDGRRDKHEEHRPTGLYIILLNRIIWVVKNRL